MVARLLDLKLIAKMGLRVDGPTEQTYGLPRAAYLRPHVPDWRACRGAALFAASPLASHAQWLNAPEARDAPRTASGEIDLEAPPPRHANGRIDLQRLDAHDNRYIRDLALDIGDEKVPYRPWARRLFDERKDGTHSGEDPDAHCLPQGVPKIDFVSYPWKLVETPSSVMIVYETFTYWRQIFTDGRTVDATAKPSCMGYSTCHWEGDTLVVTTIGFKARAGSTSSAARRRTSCAY